MNNPAGHIPLFAILAIFFLSPAASAEELLDMDGMSVVGNNELPKALFIVPWKDPLAVTAPDRPVNSLIDESLRPIDPDVFRRKLEYYDTVHSIE